MLSLKKSLDDLDDCMPKGDILREETSPFYGQKKDKILKLLKQNVFQKVIQCTE